MQRNAFSFIEHDLHARLCARYWGCTDRQGLALGCFIATGGQDGNVPALK